MLDSLAAGIMDQVFMVNLVNPTRNDGEIGWSKMTIEGFQLWYEFQLCGWTWRNWSEFVRFEKQKSVKSCLTTWLTCLFQDKKEEYETINQQPLGRLVRIDHQQLMVTGIWGDLKVVRNGQKKKHHNFEFVGELSNTATIGTICNNLGRQLLWGVDLKVWVLCGGFVSTISDIRTFYHRCTTQFRMTYSDLVDLVTLRMEEMKKEIKTLKVEVRHNLDAEMTGQ